MTPRWDDAAEALGWLRGRRPAGELLLLLHRLRVVERTTVGALLGVSASAADQVAALLDRRLVGELRVSAGPLRAPSLLHLTDLGIAALALAWDADPRRVAAGTRLRRADLTASVARLPAALDARHALARVGAAHPGRATVRDFREPCVLPRAPDRRRLSVSAYAALAWRAGEPFRVHGYLLVCDHAMVDDDSRYVARRLSDLHAAHVGEFPLVVVATSTDRASRTTRICAPTSGSPVSQCTPVVASSRPG